MSFRGFLGYDVVDDTVSQLLISIYAVDAFVWKLTLFSFQKLNWTSTSARNLPDWSFETPYQEVCAHFSFSLDLHLATRLKFKPASLLSTTKISFFICFRLLSYSLAVSLQWIRPGGLWLSIREAVLTVSPNRQYRGIFAPTTPATTGPEWIPQRTKSGLLEIGSQTDLASINIPEKKTFSFINFIPFSYPAPDDRWFRNDLLPCQECLLRTYSCHRQFPLCMLSAAQWVYRTSWTTRSRDERCLSADKEVQFAGRSARRRTWSLLLRILLNVTSFF